ncbi:MAG: hypothetical protein LBO66_05630 [Deltaproteobacteria bacterium]|jgi:hypothetical protein|nr:hypothetical protein [Deltaproteobacteria bacterium]
MKDVKYVIKLIEQLNTASRIKYDLKSLPLSELIDSIYMSYFGQEATGIDYNYVWILYNHDNILSIYQEIRIGPNSVDTISISINNSEVISKSGDIFILDEIIDNFISWIDINRNLLLQMWNTDMTDIQFINSVRKL